VQFAGKELFAKFASSWPRERDGVRLNRFGIPKSGGF
jgi:hypothetical protein